MVVLDVDPEEGMRRVGDELDRLEGAGIEFHRLVNRAFRDRGVLDPERYLVLDAGQPAEQLHARIRDAVLAHLDPSHDESTRPRPGRRPRRRLRHGARRRPCPPTEALPAEDDDEPGRRRMSGTAPTPTTGVGWDRTAQPHASAALRSAITHDELGHAFLLVGPAGVGQRELARTLAAALNCPDAVDGVPCGTCETCARIGRETHTALVTHEPEGAQHLVSSVREDWIPTASRTLTEGRRRVIRIVAADRMNESAQNAFLKALEEPPPSTLWVLEATDDTALLDTILSRCRRLDLTTWSPDALRARAVELGIPAEKVEASVRASTGSPDRLADLAARECPECGRVYVAAHGPAADSLPTPQGRPRPHRARTGPRPPRRGGATAGRRRPGAVTAVVKEVTDWAKQCAAGLAEAHAAELAQLAEDYGATSDRDLPRGVKARMEKRHKRLQRETTQAAIHRFLDEFGAYVRDLLVVHGGGGDDALVHVDHAADAAPTPRGCRSRRACGRWTTSTGAATRSPSSTASPSCSSNGCSTRSRPPPSPAASAEQGQRRGRAARRLAAVRTGDQHRHLGLVAGVPIAEGGLEIMLLELQADQDVPGGGDAEEQSAGGHRGGGPERDEEAEHDRMPNQAVQEQRWKAGWPARGRGRGVRPAAARTGGSGR